MRASLAAPRRRSPAALLTAALAAALTVAGLTAPPVHAHATIVFAELVPVPNPPVAGEPFTLELAMVDPTQLPVEDAVVRVELTPVDGGSTVEAEFAETDPGVYRTEVELDSAGEYRALMRDQTFRQEEARQTVTLAVGGTVPLTPIEFVFPPTATGGPVAVWLIWLIGVPLAVGIVVTVVVMMGGRDDDAAADA